MEPVQRLEWVKEKKHCFLCLQKHSFGKGECKSKYNCKICDKKHNFLLHIEKKIETQALIATTAQLLAFTRDEDNLLATAMVNVLTKNGDKVLIRAVIDMGSQSAMINERAQQALGLETERVCADIDGIDELKSAATKRAMLKNFPRFSNDLCFGG